MTFTNKHIPWNKGLTVADERVKRYVEKRRLKITGRKLSDIQKIKISQSLKGRLKTKEHLNAISKALKGKKRLDISGSNHYRWKGGVSAREEAIRHSIEYRLWRAAVYARDHWNCQNCGSHKKIVAHHIKSFAEYPELRMAIDNGITLCHQCHFKLHRIELGRNK